MNIEELNDRISKIEERNKRVELDKTWETSRTRIISICIITYIIALIFMTVINTKFIIAAALVPVIGFYLSTRSLTIIRKLWEKNIM